MTQHRSPHSARRAALLWLLAALLFASGLLQAGPGRKFRLDGEYGLWVTRSDSAYRVAWLTPERGAGMLRAWWNDALQVETRTPDSSLAHAVDVPLPPPGVPAIRLEYGGADGDSDRHVTRIFTDTLPGVGQLEFDGVDTIGVIGDIHGSFSELTELLRQGGWVDSSGHWSGGGGHLVLLGDIFDRGHDVIRTLWYVYELEREALAAGGRLHLVLGNHEILIFLDDLRYTSGKEQLVARYHGTTYTGLFDRYRSVLGAWLITKPGFIRINDILFTHGGVTPRMLPFTIRSFNDSLHHYLREPRFDNLINEDTLKAATKSAPYVRRLTFFFGPRSPFWYRDYVNTNHLRTALDSVFQHFGATIQIVAHTPVPYIKSFYGGQVIAVDLERPASEMLMLYRRRGRIIEYDRWRVLRDGRRRAL